MNYRIVFEDGTVISQPVQAKSVLTPVAIGRDWKKIAVIGDVDTIKSLFVDNVKYRQEWDSIRIETSIDEEGNEVSQEIVETQSIDLSDFSIAGEVVDHRDGTCTVLMGKPTEIEILQAKIAELTKAE